MTETESSERMKARINEKGGRREWNEEFSVATGSTHTLADNERCRQQGCKMRTLAGERRQQGSSGECVTVANGLGGPKLPPARRRQPTTALNCAARRAAAICVLYVYVCCLYWRYAIASTFWTLESNINFGRQRKGLEAGLHAKKTVKRQQNRMPSTYRSDNAGQAPN